MDVTLNGQQWFGSYDFTFTRNLVMHRDVPMAGPNYNSTGIRVLGRGFRLKTRSPSVKWGLQSTERMNLTSISDYTYTDDGFLNLIPGSSALKAYQLEARTWRRVDTALGQGQTLSSTVLDNRFQDETITGVAYLEAGFDEVLERDAGAPWTLYTYAPSSVEFYSYRLPNVLRIFPTAGYSKGGTLVEILGTWFDYAPQYGIVPHCKFGD